MAEYRYHGKPYEAYRKWLEHEIFTHKSERGEKTTLTWELESNKLTRKGQPCKTLSLHLKDEDGTDQNYRVVGAGHTRVEWKVVMLSFLVESSDPKHPEFRFPSTQSSDCPTGCLQTARYGQGSMRL